MSIVPPAGSGSQESNYSRRVAAGTARPIRWSRLQWQQEDAVRDLFPRNRWRAIVGAIIANQDHYWETAEGQEVHDYIHGIQVASRFSDDQWDELAEDNPDEVAALGWYHHKKD